MISMLLAALDYLSTPALTIIISIICSRYISVECGAFLQIAFSYLVMSQIFSFGLGSVGYMKLASRESSFIRTMVLSALCSLFSVVCISTYLILRRPPFCPDIPHVIAFSFLVLTLSFDGFLLTACRASKNYRKIIISDLHVKGFLVLMTYGLAINFKLNSLVYIYIYLSVHIFRIILKTYYLDIAFNEHGQKDSFKSLLNIGLSPYFVNILWIFVNTFERLVLSEYLAPHLIISYFIILSVMQMFYSLPQTLFMGIYMQSSIFIPTFWASVCFMTLCIFSVFLSIYLLATFTDSQLYHSYPSIIAVGISYAVMGLSSGIDNLLMLNNPRLRLKIWAYAFICFLIAYLLCNGDYDYFPLYRFIFSIILVSFLIGNFIRMDALIRK